MYVCNQCGKEFAMKPDGCDNCGAPVTSETFRIENPSPIPPLNRDEEMHLNMQLYMEHCLNNGYVTPKEWLTNHKIN